jgi:dTDP-4-dehydrorhamnose reductase
LKRVLLLGGAGQLGTAIRLRWSDCEITAPSHDELALERADDLRDALDRIRPDLLVNAAAFHDVDQCEQEPERAFAVNALAVGRAAELARERDVAFLTISTDYVFDGKAAVPYAESARPSPISLYGLSKLAGEHLALRSDAQVFVVRTCGLYGVADSSSRRSLIDRVLMHDERSAPMRVVADVFASPTFAGDLAVALRKLVETQSYGLYHAVNPGPVSWYEFAQVALELAHRKGSIEPIPAREWKTMALRPQFSALENARLGALGIELPSWRDGIAAHLGVQVR